jgi:hypothetical protein
VSASSHARAGADRTYVDDPRMPGLTLGQAVGIFVRRESPRAFFVAVTVLGLARLWVGGFGLADLLLAVALVALHPFSEWVIHVGVLHFRPRKWRNETIDFHLSYAHREHHKAPHDERWWFIPRRSAIIAFLLVAGVSFVLLRDLGLWLSYMFVSSVIGLVYEWTHFLCHSSYRPRGRWYKGVWRHHRLHHFKNEHYWMGVTMHLGDRVLGTKVDPKTVETSPTCRDLLAKDGED